MHGHYFPSIYFLMRDEKEGRSNKAKQHACGHPKKFVSNILMTCTLLECLSSSNKN